MVFSKEDNAAFNNSEVMKELEKLAMAGELDLPEDAYSPVEEEVWEEESEPTDKLIDAVEEFSGDTGSEDTEHEDLAKLLESHQYLLEQITKISYELADNSNIVGAYRIERALQNIKSLLEDE